MNESSASSSVLHGSSVALLKHDDNVDGVDNVIDGADAQRHELRSTDANDDENFDDLLRQSRQQRIVAKLRSVRRALRRSATTRLSPQLVQETRVVRVDYFILFYL